MLQDWSCCEGIWTPDQSLRVVVEVCVVARVVGRWMGRVWISVLNRRVTETCCWNTGLKHAVGSCGWSTWLKHVVEACGWSTWLKHVVEAHGWTTWKKHLVKMIVSFTFIFQLNVSSTSSHLVTWFDSRLPAPPPTTATRTHTHAHTYARTHIHTHTCIHAHTHSTQFLCVHYFTNFITFLFIILSVNYSTFGFLHIFIFLCKCDCFVVLCVLSVYFWIDYAYI